MKRILVTGAFGLVGSDLTLALQKKFGQDSVISMGRKTIDSTHEGIIVQGDVRDMAFLEKTIVDNEVGEIYHLAGLLSVGSEKQPDLAWDVNVNGLRCVLDLAKKYNLKVFWPSSIAAFGPTTPKENVPQHTILEPTTIYGATKVAGELLCQYYFLRYGVDVRSLRYPGLNGYKAAPGDGTTEYAIHVFYDLIKHNSYNCFLSRDTMLPMMYMDDAIAGTMQLMEAPSEVIRVRTSYNFSAVSFTPEQIATEIQKISPSFKMTYTPDHHQQIADSWPKTIDDSQARTDWGWKHHYDLPTMTRALYEGVLEKTSNLTQERE